MLRFPWVRLIMAAAAALLLSSLPTTAKTLRPDPVPDAWQRPHADGGNTGFANVVTVPAVKPSQTAIHLGDFGVGAGPVIGPDGTVYVGTLQGKLIAFHRDGSRAWDRQLDDGQQILASPVVGSDGSIFVVSQSIFTDTRFDPPFTRPDSTLHKFLPGGGYAWKVPFPEYGTKLPVPYGSGGTDAPPNIWRYNGEEAVMVPVLYKNRLTHGHEVRLLAFSASGGAVLGDAPVGTYVQTVTGSSGLCDTFMCGLGGGFTGPTPNNDPNYVVPYDLRVPLAAAAIYTLPGGGTPWIVVSDNLEDIVGFTFSAQSGFTEGFRAHDESWQLVGTPMVTPDAESFVPEARSVIRWLGQAIKKPPRTKINTREPATVARTATGDVLFGTRITVRVRHPGSSQLEETVLPAQTIAQPAVSQKHVFVSTRGSLLTYDAATMQQVAKFDWQKGGISPPAIGPYGDVYAIADNTLHVFPGPCAACKDLPPLDNVPTLTVAPTTPASTGQSHFENPQGPHGLRLYACTQVGGEDCGKPVAAAFCQTQGFATSEKYDTKSKKVQAETLTGETCGKNKCKVFDYINCKN
jgi:hypothetical protein